MSAWFFASLLGVLLAGGAESPTPGSCACELARDASGWCDVHEVGYIGDLEIRSARLFETLDPHGHEVVHETFDCPRCQDSIASDGFCFKHGVGFVDGLAYFSQISYYLTRGGRRPPPALDCPACADDATPYGWCERCQLGRVGRVTIDSREDFDRLVKRIELLDLANEAALRCERCAVAVMRDSECPICRIRYKDGKPLDDRPAAAAEPERR